MLLKGLIHEEIAQPEPGTCSPQQGWNLVQTHLQLIVPEKSPFLRVLCPLKGPFTPLTRIPTLAKVTNKRLHDVISCASKAGLDDNPLSLFALKVEACLLGL